MNKILISHGTDSLDSHICVPGLRENRRRLARHTLSHVVIRKEGVFPVAARRQSMNLLWVEQCMYARWSTTCLESEVLQVVFQLFMFLTVICQFVNLIGDLGIGMDPFGKTAVLHEGFLLF